VTMKTSKLSLKTLLVASLLSVSFVGASTTQSNAQSMNRVHIGIAIGLGLQFAVKEGTRAILAAQDRALYLTAMRICTDAIIFNRRDFRVGYRCNPNRRAILRCTAGRPGFLYITHIQRRSAGRFLVFWRSAGQCRQKYGDCSNLTGHCTDRVIWHNRHEADISVSGSSRNPAAVRALRYYRR